MNSPEHFLSVMHFFSLSLLLSRLPPSANIEKVTSSLSPEGLLTVEAPLAVPAIESSEMSIPVTVEKKAVEKK